MASPLCRQGRDWGLVVPCVCGRGQAGARDVGAEARRRRRSALTRSGVTAMGGGCENPRDAG
jgi:hypothetical protein